MSEAAEDETTLAELLLEMREHRRWMERMERKIATIAERTREPAPVDDDPSDEELREAERVARSMGMVVREYRR